MLLEATGMACKLYFLLLALIVMSVCVSAHRPLVENHEAPSSVPKPSQSNSDGKLKVASVPYPPPEVGIGKLKLDGAPSGGKLKVNSVPYPPPEVGIGKLKLDGAPLNGGKLKVDGTPPHRGSLNINVDASEHVPSPNSNGGGGKLKFDSTPSGSLGAIGLIPGISLVPGGDGSFHFSLGPIDLGGNIGWGAVAPGYAVAYSQPQPYVVVSPYSSVYGEPAPAPVFGYGQPAPVSGYGQPAPVVGFGSPTPVSGYSSPTPVAGYGSPTPVVGYSSPTPVVGYGQPSPSPNPIAPPMTWSGQPSQGYSSFYESARGNEPSSPQN